MTRVKPSARKDLAMLKGEHGYSLVELIVVMAIFTIVIMVASQGFKTVLTQVGQQSKMMETDIGSIVGLEVLRSDVQNVGYGLPWAFTTPAPTYTEVATSDSGMPMTADFWPTGQDPRTYNDAGSGVPRAVRSGNTTFNLKDGIGSQYLVLKSLSVATSSGATQKKTMTVAFTDAGKTKTQWVDAAGVPTRNFVSTDRVIVLRNTFSNGVPSRQLQVNSTGAYSTTFGFYSTMSVPHSVGDVFQVYGVDPTTNPRMPFNRADYYVSRPSPAPPACAPNTGVLYKAVVNQGSGFSEIPLMDCVADMQVVYGIGPVGSTEINFHQATLPSTWTAQDIRQQVKEVRLYILAHNGKKDTSLTFPTSQLRVGESFSGTVLGRDFDLPTQIGAGWQNYRWKVYTIVVRPQNLIQ